MKKEIVVSKKMPFLGRKVTPENRHQVKQEYYDIFMQKIAIDDPENKMPHDEKVRSANFYAKLEVAREKKHYKAWLKGDKFYTYHKNTYPVLQDAVDGKPLYLNDVMDIMPFGGDQEE